jgi:hypothetical protein
MLTAVICVLALGGCAVKGNDTGGIIAWSPESEANAQQLASDHCVRYGKYALITSTTPRQGDYIGFVCERPGTWGPILR